MSMSRLTLVALLPLIACAPKDAEPDPVAPPPEPAELVIRTADYSFAAPDTVAPGVTKIRLINDGEVPHHAILIRVDSGKTMDDIAAVMANNEEPDWITVVGGGGAVTKGGENVTYSDLAPGLHVLVCFLQDGADSPPHVALGMVKPIVVMGERTMAVMPEADAEIRLVDYGFEMPTLAAGTHNIRLVNGGEETHEIVIIRLPEGVTLESLMANMTPESEPVGTMIGGNGAVSSGGANIWQVTLTPGEYAAFCWVPSPTDGTPHVMKGMTKAFTVS